MITTIISMYWNCIHCSRLNIKWKITRGCIRYAIKKFIVSNIDWFVIWCILVQTYQSDAVKCFDTFLIFKCPFQHSMSMSKSNDSRWAIRYMVSYYVKCCDNSSVLHIDTQITLILGCHYFPLFHIFCYVWFFLCLLVYSLTTVNKNIS